MSIGTILSTANTGLQAAQAGLRTVSDNVANANTPGYVRKVVNQSSLVSMGAGAGVNVDGVKRVVDRYLESASLTAGATAGKAGVLSELLDRAQSLFGDPSGTDSYFSRLDEAYNQFAALSNDPSSSLQRGQALVALQSFFDDTARIAGSLTEIQAEADTRIRGSVDRVNDLLEQIAKLNTDIRRAQIGRGDSSGSENIQAQLISELSGLIDIQATEASGGGMILRTNDGMLMADERAGTVIYNRSDTAAGFLTLTPANGGGQTFDAAFSGGEIVGLIQGRNGDIPEAVNQLLEFTSRAADEINRAHNSNIAVPAPATLTGKNTGLDLVTAVGGFSGDTTIALLDSGGVIQNRIAIDFDGSTMSLNGGAAAAFTPATFITTLNTALTGVGTASFTNGVLSIAATTGGVAIADDATTPALKAGQGFSHFFGLNDLIRSTSRDPNTGLTGTDTHGFTAGQQITLRLAEDNGTRLRDITVTVPGGTTMNNLITAMNATGTGVAPYGSFALNSSGRLVFTSAATPDASVTVVTDSTARGVGGPTMSSFFGLGISGKAQAAASFSVQAAIYQNPSLMAVGKLNLAAGVGVPAIAAGDGRGATSLAQAGENLANFAAAGGLPAATMSVSRYASEFGGSLGRNAASAETAKRSAESVKTEADNRRASYESVNMDEELVRLTQYQQAFNASARLITAANQLYDVLLAMI